MTDDQAGFLPKMMQHFAECLIAELGRDTLIAVLRKAELPTTWADPLYFKTLNGQEAALAYSKLQHALRTYYGRGARGVLVRIGGKLWEGLLKESSLTVKTQAAFVRGVPINLRRKFALELIPRLIHDQNGSITVHSLDLDLLLVDHASFATLGQFDSAPICHVTQGMIRECLYWAIGYEHDIEEISCRAFGAKACEFKITVGG